MGERLKELPISYEEFRSLMIETLAKHSEPTQLTEFYGHALLVIPHDIRWPRLIPPRPYFPGIDLHAQVFQ